MLRFLSIEDISTLDIAISERCFRKVFLECLLTENLSFRVDAEYFDKCNEYSILPWIINRKINLKTLTISNLESGELRICDFVAQLGTPALQTLEEIEVDFSYEEDGMTDIIEREGVLLRVLPVLMRTATNLKKIDVYGAAPCKTFVPALIETSSGNIRSLAMQNIPLLTQGSLHHIFSKCPKLESFSLRSFYFFHIDSFSGHSPLLFLKELVIDEGDEELEVEDATEDLPVDGKHFSRFQDHHLIDLASLAPQLESLTLMHCLDLSPVSLIHVSHSCVKLKNIEFACWSRNDRLWMNALEALLKHCPELTDVFFCWKSDFNSDEEEHFFGSLIDYGSKLLSLKLTADRLSKRMIIAIFNGCRSLRSLTLKTETGWVLNHNNLTWDSHEPLASLDSLCFKDNNISVDFLLVVLSRCPHITSFAYLSKDGRVEERIIAFLGSKCKSLTHLKIDAVETLVLADLENVSRSLESLKSFTISDISAMRAGSSGENQVIAVCKQAVELNVFRPDQEFEFYSRYLW